MPRSFAIAATGLFALTLLSGACGGGSKTDATATSPARTTAAATSAAASVATKPPAPAATVAPGTPALTGATPVPATTAAGTPANAAPAVATFNETQAKALLDEASLKPQDGGSDWVVTGDTATDNAAAAAADPSSAASNDRCGRLAGRLVTDGPKDNVSAYLGGSLVTAFSQLTVYATAAGAADCSAEGATKFQAPGALARAFGTIFTDPDAVVVKPVDYPQVGDGSFATSLTGEINASGTVVGLQIVIVAFLKGNTSAVVGVAYAPLTTPSTTELKSFVDLVLQRIAANQ